VTLFRYLRLILNGLFTVYCMFLKVRIKYQSNYFKKVNLKLIFIFSPKRFENIYLSPHSRHEPPPWHPYQHDVQMWKSQRLFTRSRAGLLKEVGDWGGGKCLRIWARPSLRAEIVRGGGWNNNNNDIINHYCVVGRLVVCARARARQTHRRGRRRRNA